MVHKSNSTDRKEQPILYTYYFIFRYIRLAEISFIVDVLCTYTPQFDTSHSEFYTQDIYYLHTFLWRETTVWSTK